MGNRRPEEEAVLKGGDVATVAPVGRSENALGPRFTPRGAAEIRAHLDKILQSQGFSHANLSSRFLQFAVEQALQGRSDAIKEYVVALEVFGRGVSFDPRVDSIVRVSANRLRSKLQHYYDTEGRDDPIRIDLPKGHYVPHFSKFTPSDSDSRPHGLGQAVRLPSVRTATAVGVIALLAGILAYWKGQPHKEPNPFSRQGIGSTATTQSAHVGARTAYLKGRYFWNQRTPQSLERSLGYFKQAVTEDPTFAKAHAGLADAYATLGNSDVFPPKLMFPAAKVAAEEALELNPQLAEAYVSLAYVQAFYEWDWSSAEQTFRLALQYDPSYATGHHWYALLLMNSGRLDEAVVQIRRAQRADPLSTIITTNTGLVYYMRREYDLAIAEFTKTLDLDPNNYVAYWNLGKTYAQKGLLEEAIEALEKARTFSGNSFVILGNLGHCYALAEKKTEAKAILQELSQASKERYISPYWTALVYVGLNELDRTFEWLEKALMDRSVWLVALKVDPVFDHVRSEPRFIALLQKLGLAS